MPCFGSKRVEVVPSIRAPDDGKPTTPGRKGAGVGAPGRRDAGALGRRGAGATVLPRWAKG